MKRIYWFLALCVLFAALTIVTTGKAHAAICGGTPCVDSADIINGQVSGADMSPSIVVPGSKITNESITGAKIQNGSLTGADLAAGTIGSAQVNSAQVQVRVSGTCAAGYSVNSINADGTVVCELDDMGPSYSSGAGLSLTGTVFSIATGGVGSAQINNTQVQSRVAGACATGSSINAINADGTVGCETDDTGAAAHRVVVATSGGDYTTISAALGAISPTAADPYVIDVMPGTYIENITMKSYVHLRGAGREVTAIQSPSTSTTVITLTGITQVAISGLTIGGGSRGIYNDSSSPTITGNTVTGNSSYGIYNYYSSPTITGNTVTGNSGYGGIYNHYSSPTITGNTVTGNSYGIYNYASSPTITGNTVTGNSGEGIYNFSSTSPTITGNTVTGNSNIGISNNGSSPTITGNTVTGNGYHGIYNYYSSPTITGNTVTGNSSYGIRNNNSSSPTVINNRITGNGGATYTDISVDSSSAPNISFNVYDDITGTTGVGMYNVNSTGGAAPAP